MDTSTDYFQAQAMPIGELLEFWEIYKEVVEYRREQQDKEIEEVRRKRGV